MDLEAADVLSLGIRLDDPYGTGDDTRDRIEYCTFQFHVDV
jgi:hypothetical protein